MKIYYTLNATRCVSEERCMRLMMMMTMMIREREIRCINIVNSAIQLILTGHPRFTNTHTHPYNGTMSIEHSYFAACALTQLQTYVTTTNRMRSIFRLIRLNVYSVGRLADRFVSSSHSYQHCEWPNAVLSSCANAQYSYVLMLSMHYIHFIRGALSGLICVCGCCCYGCCCYCWCIFSAVSPYIRLNWRSSHQLTNILLYVRAPVHSRLNRVVFSLIYHFFFGCCYCCCCCCLFVSR